MKMTETRRFSEALGSWMHFEACCFRAGLFSESSLKSAIGSVASSLHANHMAARVHADYPLPAIQRVPSGEATTSRGRKRCVDFALIYDDGRQPPSEPFLLIEGKWAGSSHCTTENIMTDFVRLSIMKRARPGATCLFVLAGHSKDIHAVLSHRPFTGTRGDVIHSNGTGAITKFKFRENDMEHQRAFAQLVSDFHAANIKVPASFSTSGSTPYPAAPAKFKAAAWEVRIVNSQNLVANQWPPPKRLSLIHI